MLDQFGFAEIEYEKHYNQFARPFLVDGNEANNRYFVHEAQQNHIYGVNNALLDMVGDALDLLQALNFTEDARHHFQYGVMRRLRMIDTSFKSFQSVIPPNRIIPLSQEQSDRVCRDLNAIYIDILGLLDNYAWVAIYQAGTLKTQTARPLDIGLFKPRFAADAGLSETAGVLRAFADWEREVKTRRNPAAHRIPLYVPHAALTPDDILEFERYEGLLSEALRAGEFEKLEGLRDAQRRVGTLVPKFLHDPREPAADIYPTLPGDIGHAIKIGRIVHGFLRKHGGAAKDLVAGS